ncbi:MAG: hypothetical protein KKB13_22175 [Chloroflexi bacterium]|nr:hypothetical protein [Chloroflexota bacterium]
MPIENKDFSAGHGVQKSSPYCLPANKKLAAFSGVGAIANVQDGLLLTTLSLPLRNV